MKYFIKVHWWRDCNVPYGRTANVTIDENPLDWLTRQRARIANSSQWTDIVIQSCCQVAPGAPVSPELVYDEPGPSTAEGLFVIFVILGALPLLMACTYLYEALTK